MFDRLHPNESRLCEGITKVIGPLAKGSGEMLIDRHFGCCGGPNRERFFLFCSGVLGAWALARPCGSLKVGVAQIDALPTPSSARFGFRRKNRGGAATLSARRSCRRRSPWTGRLIRSTILA